MHHVMYYNGLYIVDYVKSMVYFRGANGGMKSPIHIPLSPGLSISFLDTQWLSGR